MSAYYNEFEPYAASWLRKLIAAKLIADGEVDERSITDVRSEDLRGFAQCHFFAGIGGWSYAIKLAGWPDARSVWTGSCPCQPYSVAGSGKGDEDERDLWPHFYRLIGESRPSIIFGEQIADAVRWGWLDRAFVDLERLSYACGSAVLSASLVGASHQRNRLYFVANANGEGQSGYRQDSTFPLAAESIEPVDGHALSEARRALDGDYKSLLPGDGISVKLEQCAIKGYGNAIVPQVAAEFIRAVLA